MSVSVACFYQTTAKAKVKIFIEYECYSIAIPFHPHRKLFSFWLYYFECFAEYALTLKHFIHLHQLFFCCWSLSPAEHCFAFFFIWMSEYFKWHGKWKQEKKNNGHIRKNVQSFRHFTHLHKAKHYDKKVVYVHCVLQYYFINFILCIINISKWLQPSHWHELLKPFREVGMGAAAIS